MGDYFFMPCCKENKDWRQGGQKVGQNLCNYLIYISLQRLSLIC